MKTLKYSFVFAVVIGFLIQTSPPADAGRGGKPPKAPSRGGMSKGGGSMHQRSHPQPKHSPKSFRISPRNTPTGGSTHKAPMSRGKSPTVGGSKRNPVLGHEATHVPQQSHRISPQVKSGVNPKSAPSTGNLLGTPAAGRPANQVLQGTAGTSAGGSAGQFTSKTKNPSSSQGSTSRPGVVANQGTAGTSTGGTTPQGFEPQVKKPLKDATGHSPGTPSAPLPNSNWQLAQ